MKLQKYILLFTVLSTVGCTQSNLTWTPTSEEWALMTPVEKNQWFMSEKTARQQQNKNLANLFRNMTNSYERQLDRQYYGQYPKLLTPNQSRSNFRPNFWQEQYYQQKWWEQNKSLGQRNLEQSQKKYQDQQKYWQSYLNNLP